ncbi:AbrB family transcriptional regulator [Thiorhodovibrio winogradskyi]|nr:AbrB family transcriptional regulator [Thiorhodovibrio winogradskyi]
MSGRSQAIRWPAKLRLNASEVLIDLVGEGYFVQPKREPQSNLGEWLRNFYVTTEPLPDDFLAERNDTRPQSRDWD